MISEKTMKEWVAALLSGRYEEHEGHLRCYEHPERFDVMGILLDVIDPDGWGLVSPGNQSSSHEALWSHSLASSPFTPSPDLLPGDVMLELFHRTDLDHAGHAEIAEYIMATLPARIQRHELELEQVELGAEYAEACA